MKFALELRSEVEKKIFKSLGSDPCNGFLSFSKDTSFSFVGPDGNRVTLISTLASELYRLFFCGGAKSLSGRSATLPFTNYKAEVHSSHISA